MLAARVKRIVTSLADLRIRLLDGDLIPWSRMISSPKPSTEALYGTLVSLPSEEPLKTKLEEMEPVTAASETRSRLSNYYGRLRDQHPNTRDVTLLCGWWRLDDVTSPEYEDFRKEQRTSSSEGAATDEDKKKHHIVSGNNDMEIISKFLSAHNTDQAAAITRDLNSLEGRRYQILNRSLELFKEDIHLAKTCVVSEFRSLRAPGSRSRSIGVKHRVASTSFQLSMPQWNSEVTTRGADSRVAIERQREKATTEKATQPAATATMVNEASSQSQDTRSVKAPEQQTNVGQNAPDADILSNSSMEDLLKY